MSRKRSQSTLTTSNPSSLTVPRRIEKAIRDLARRSKYDPQEVYEVALEQGIIQATALFEDVIKAYDDIAEARKNLRKLKNRPPIPQDDESTCNRIADEGFQMLDREENGSGEDGFGFISRDVAPIAPELFDPGVEPGFDDATLGPGFEEEEPPPDHAHEGSASDHLLEMPVE